MFHTENARLLFKSAVFACGHMLPRRCVVFRVVTGRLIYYWALCRLRERHRTTTEHNTRVHMPWDRDGQVEACGIH